MDRNDSKSHDQSLSLDHVSVVPLAQTSGKVSIRIPIPFETFEVLLIAPKQVSKQETFVEKICV
jgi:hypothetical protein